MKNNKFKCRGINKKGEFVYGYPCYKDIHWYLVDYQSYRFTELKQEPDRFTNLFDMNKKPIYENDIVIWNDGRGKCEINTKKGWIRKAIVKFDPVYNLELTKDTPSGEAEHKFGYWNFIYKDSKKYLKVIDNIHNIKEEN